jgi:hypothetical protein
MVFIRVRWPFIIYLFISGLLKVKVGKSGLYRINRMDDNGQGKEIIVA